MNGRLYRSALVLLSVPLLVLAFSIARAGPLPAPQLPPSFDGPATRELAAQLATNYPDRVPGSTGALQAAGWFRGELKPYGLRIAFDTWRQHIEGVGTVSLENIWAVARGASRDAIVVMAHRDDTGTGPGADDDASGTAALIELARGYAQPSTRSPGVRAAHTVVFLSTDGGSFGGLGAARFAQHLPFHVLAVLDLDAIAGPGRPHVVLTDDTPRSPPSSLVETVDQRVREQTGRLPRHDSVLDQLIDLGFPLTLYDQGPFVARGIPAVTLTTAGTRPPGAFTDRAEALDTNKLAALGRAAQETIGSLDQGLELSQGTTSYVLAGHRVVRGWAIELLLAGLLLPFAIAAVDLFARCRRRRIPLAPALRALQSRAGFWLFVGVAFYAFRLVGAWPSGPDRPPNPALPSSGDWPLLALIAFGVVLLCGWVVARHRLVPRRPVTAEEQLAGETAALLGIGIVALLVLATNPFALIFLLPAAHAWMWLPQLRSGWRAPARAVVLTLGFAGPALLMLSLAIRFGLGFDAPWYLLELVSVGWVHVVPVAIALGGAACAAQLVAASSGRYAPYPAPHERPDRGPLRTVIRGVVLTVRARRRVTEERRRAFGP